MKKIVLFALITMFLVTTLALASDAKAGSYYVKTDAQAGVTTYQITGEPSITAPVPANIDGSLKINVDALSDGVHNWTIAAGNQRGYGQSVNFTFTLPAKPGPPVSPKLVFE